MAYTAESRPSSPGNLVGLPHELQLRVFEQIGGTELCALESACHDLRRLVSSNEYLYQHALMDDFGSSAAFPGSTPLNWKAQYVQAFVKVRLDALDQQKRAYSALRLRVEELDQLLDQADDLKALLGAPELSMSEPSMVLAAVGDMEQDVMQQRWDVSEDLALAEAQLNSLQSEVSALLARVPCTWIPPSLKAAVSGCTIA